MTIQLVRKPPIGNARSTRLKVTFDGRHTTEEKGCMVMQALSWVLNKQGIGNIGLSDLYLSLLDPSGYPVTTLRDDRSGADIPVAGYDLIIKNPYDCAADEYDRRQPPPVPRPF